MKVCPVCEMEEDDNALSCSMCGSDFEPSVKEVPTQESAVDEPDDISSDIAEMELGEVGNPEPDSANKTELSEEEKLLEETLKATETGNNEEESRNSLAVFSEQYNQIRESFVNLSKRLDKVFLTKGELNYIAPLSIVVLSILLLSGVVGLLVSTVPATDEISTDDWTTTKPVTDTVYDENNTARSVTLGRPVGEPYSGDSFHLSLIHI